MRGVQTIRADRRILSLPAQAREAGTLLTSKAAVKKGVCFPHVLVFNQQTLAPLPAAQQSKLASGDVRPRAGVLELDDTVQDVTLSTASVLLLISLRFWPFDRFPSTSNFLC